MQNSGAKMTVFRLENISTALSGGMWFMLPSLNPSPLRREGLLRRVAVVIECHLQKKGHYRTIFNTGLHGYSTD